MPQLEPKAASVSYSGPARKRVNRVWVGYLHHFFTPHDTSKATVHAGPDCFFDSFAFNCRGIRELIRRGKISDGRLTAGFIRGHISAAAQILEHFYLCQC